MKYSAQQLSWLLYDPANAAYALIVRTVFAPLFLGYCAKGIYTDSQITSSWSVCASIAGIVAGVISVLCGPWADRRRKKRFMVFLATAAGILSTAGFILIPGKIPQMVLALSFIGLMSYMIANSFYDSLLPGIAAPQERDHLSTTGYAWGYAGGVGSFLLCLAPVFMLEAPYSFYCAFAIAAVWWTLGTIPLYRNVRESDSAQTVYRLRETFTYIFKEKNILLFLISYFLYIDGVGTILLAATPLADGLKISAANLLITILALQFIGLPCTLLYGKFAKRFSARALVITAIAVYITIALLVTAMSVCTDLPTRQVIFIICAALIGTSQGGIQSLSRSLFSRIIPAERAAELFAVYNIFGKFTTIVGPLFILIATRFTGKAELGITMLILPFTAGALMLSRVKIPAGVER